VPPLEDMGDPLPEGSSWSHEVTRGSRPLLGDGRPKRTSSSIKPAPDLGSCSFVAGPWNRRALGRAHGLQTRALPSLAQCRRREALATLLGGP
jgi:hypothetical protein